MIHQSTSVWLALTTLILDTCSYASSLHFLSHPPDTSIPFMLNNNPCLTDPSICFLIPSAPRNLRINQVRHAMPPGSSDPNSKFAILELAWDPPERSHGDLHGYQLTHRLIGPPSLFYPQSPLHKDLFKTIKRNVTKTAYTSTIEDGFSECSTIVGRRYNLITLE